MHTYPVPTNYIYNSVCLLFFFLPIGYKMKKTHNQSMSPIHMYTINGKMRQCFIKLHPFAVVLCMISVVCVVFAKYFPLYQLYYVQQRDGYDNASSVSIQTRYGFCSTLGRGPRFLNNYICLWLYVRAWRYIKIVGFRNHQVGQTFVAF